MDGRLMGTDARPGGLVFPATADFKKAIERDARLYLASGQVRLDSWTRPANWTGRSQTTRKRWR